MRCVPFANLFMYLFFCFFFLFLSWLVDDLIYLLTRCGWMFFFPMAMTMGSWQCISPDIIFFDSAEGQSTPGTVVLFAFPLPSRESKALLRVRRIRWQWCECRRKALLWPYINYKPFYLFTHGTTLAWNSKLFDIILFHFFQILTLTGRRREA